jgi:cytochrome c peroxidase
MRNACSLGLVRGLSGNVSIITRGLTVGRRCPRIPVRTQFGWRWLTTIATWAILTSGEVGAQQPADPELIEKGRKLFFEETFNGNGRTCGTCHPANNNFTIDPASVRRVRGNDPLFVAEPSGPDLNALEVRQLLKRNALVLENLDGLDQPGVMRGVPHTLALSTSSRRMGWSGDGSPGAPLGDGSLRSFATGAVIQHFPKTLNRVEDVDFRLPDENELDALEAFQLSLGRQENIDDLANLVFADDTVGLGQDLFFSSPSVKGARSCNGCHTNAGTSDAQLDTGTAMLPTAPACEAGYKAPGDGGEGGQPVETFARSDLCANAPRGGPQALVTFRGNGLFNVPPLIEAADTAPFFHNNSVATLEGAVAFYTSDTFNDSASGGDNAFVLDQDEVNAIGALLRALNALENIRSSNAYAARAIDPDELAPRDELVELALAETTDAIEVLTKGPVELFAGTDAVQLLEEARELERQALGQDPLSTDLLGQAIARKEAARDEIVE